jgi:hypothetical protein
MRAAYHVKKKLPKLHWGGRLCATMAILREGYASDGEPGFARVWRAAGRLETWSKWALICIVVGWFFTDTLVASLASLHRGIRFFYLPAVIADPTRMFFGVDFSLQSALFSLVCLACVLAPVAAHLSTHRYARFAYLAPLILIALCGAMLYSKTAGDFFTAPSDNGIGSSVVHLANRLAARGSDLASRHVAIGAGGYLATIASIVLAVQGIRGYFEQASRLPNKDAA